MFAWLAVGAAAQVGPERVVTDADQRGAWAPADTTHPIPGRGQGLALAPDPDGTAVAAAELPFVVTHEGLRMEVLAADLWPVRLAVHLEDPAQGALDLEQFPAVGRWTEVALDTVDLCGASGGLSLTVDTLADTPVDLLPVYVDRIRMTGDVCPQFRDVDADGRCTQGFDRDGDGLCVSEGEPVERPQIADCNDTSPGPRCLALVAEAQDHDLVLTATGAEPGEAVWFFASERRGQSCPPALGGVCMDLAAPRSAGHPVADAQGVAHLVLPLVEGTWYQAGVLRVGLDSDLSAVAEASGVVVQPDPITDR